MPEKLAAYTYACVQRGVLRIRGLTAEGKRIMQTIKPKPKAWVPLDLNISKWKSSLHSTESGWTSLIGSKPLMMLEFKTAAGFREFASANSEPNENGRRTLSKNIVTAPTNAFVHQYLCDAFPEEIKYDSSKMAIYNYDIETEVGHRNVPDSMEVIIRHTDTGEERNLSIKEFEGMSDRESWVIQYGDNWLNYSEHPYRFMGGFPDPKEAIEEITLITVKDVNKSIVHTWGKYDFATDRTDVDYRRFETEIELLTDFIQWWSHNYPDILSGWNTDGFDNVYLAKRIERVLGKDKMLLLSPFGEVEFSEKEVKDTDKTILTVSILGISSLDYLKLYKKFGFAGTKESYKLDDISMEELGIKKVENPTGGTFREFYSGEFDVNQKPDENAHEIRKLGYIRTQMRHRPEYKDKFDILNRKIIKDCQQTFVDYNIRDVELVDKLDKKRKLLELAMGIAYLGHINFEDVFSPVKTWTMIIFNHLQHRKVMIPNRSNNNKDGKFEGAYVKSPLVGKHEYLASYDLDSLYPHILMQYNISLETLAENNGKRVFFDLDLDHLVNKTEDTSMAKDLGLSMAGSGYCFTKEKEGIIPELCRTFYADRKATKKKYLHFKAEHEKIVEELRKRGIEISH